MNRILTIFILTFFVQSCFTPYKATRKFSKINTIYPEIVDEYVANHFPIKDSLIKGDTVLTFDTLYIAGELQTDTLITKDTVFIIKTLPPKLITKTIHIHDTIIKEGGATKAKLELSEINNRKLTTLLEKKTNEYDKVKKKRDWWRIVALCCMGIIGIGVFFKVKKVISPLK